MNFLLLLDFLEASVYVSFIAHVGRARQTKKYQELSRNMLNWGERINNIVDVNIYDR